MATVHAAEDLTLRVSPLVKYEVDVEIDPQSRHLLVDEVAKARHLYDDLISDMRETMKEIRAIALYAAGPEAQTLALTAASLRAEIVAGLPKLQGVDRLRHYETLRHCCRELWPLLMVGKHRAREQIRSRLRARAVERERQVLAATLKGLGAGTAEVVANAARKVWQGSIAGGCLPSPSTGRESYLNQLTVFIGAEDGAGIEYSTFLKSGSDGILIDQAGEPRSGFKITVGAPGPRGSIMGRLMQNAVRLAPLESKIGAVRLVPRAPGRSASDALQLVGTARPGFEDAKEIVRRPLVVIYDTSAGDAEMNVSLIEVLSEEKWHQLAPPPFGTCEDLAQFLTKRYSAICLYGHQRDEIDSASALQKAPGLTRAHRKALYSRHLEFRRALDTACSMTRTTLMEAVDSPQADHPFPLHGDSVSRGAGLVGVGSHVELGKFGRSGFLMRLVSRLHRSTSINLPWRELDWARMWTVRQEHTLQSFLSGI